MRSLSRRAIRCEEWSKVAIDDKTGPLSSSDVHAIFATWKGTTGTDPTRYFETGPNHLLPKFWSGILHCANFSFEVLPIGGLSLQPSDKSQLDRNLSEMLTTVLGGSSIQATAGEISSTGSREDVLLLAFCNAFQLARRVRVIRSYSSITRQGRTLSGRLSFRVNQSSMLHHRAHLHQPYWRSVKTPLKTDWSRKCSDDFVPNVGQQFDATLMHATGSSVTLLKALMRQKNGLASDLTAYQRNIKP